MWIVGKNQALLIGIVSLLIPLSHCAATVDSSSARASSYSSASGTSSAGSTSDASSSSSPDASSISAAATSSDAFSSSSSDSGSSLSSDTSSNYLTDGSLSSSKESFKELSDKFAEAALKATQEAEARTALKGSPIVHYSTPLRGIEDILPPRSGSHLEDDNGCKYSGEWQDCDPFKMMRIKEMRLVEGSYACVEAKNVTKPCTSEDLPPGTIWLLKEHKKCILQLQKLKIMVEDLHRYIDLIHQRGQSLFNSYNDLRKKLMDIRKEISNLGRLNQASDQTIYRLKKEVEDWKTRSNKVQMDMNQLRAQYKQLEIDVRRQKIAHTENLKANQEAKSVKTQLAQKLYDISSVNRNLKIQLLDAERYKEQLREQMNSIAIYRKKTNEVNLEITKMRDKINQCKLDGLQTVQKIKKMPKFNKDTRVNLDMSMWITHNISQEAGPQIMNYQPLSYGQDPTSSLDSRMVVTGEAGAITGHSQAITDHSQAITGHSQAITGHSEAITGQAEASAYAAEAAQAMSDATSHNQLSAFQEQTLKAETDDSD